MDVIKFYVSGCWGDVTNNHLIQEHGSFNDAQTSVRTHNRRLLQNGFRINWVDGPNRRFHTLTSYRLVKTLKDGKKITRYVGIWEATTPHKKLVKTNKQHKMCF